MSDPMDRIVSFFHENGNLARAREVREALDQFEARMPERIRDRILSNLPVEECSPTGWTRFQRFADFRTAAFHGLGWERRRQGSGELVDWVGFGWWYLGKHDYLLNPQDRPFNPCRWIGWWRPDLEDQSPEEIQLFRKACTILSELTGSPPGQSHVDSEPQHADGWPYFLGVPAAEVDALRVDTEEFATALSKLLPEIRRAADQLS
jgi:hypothetical protein